MGQKLIESVNRSLLDSLLEKYGLKEDNEEVVVDVKTQKFSFMLTIPISGEIKKTVARFKDTGEEVPPDIHLSAEVKYDLDKLEDAIQKACLARFSRLLGGEVSYVGSSVLVGFPSTLRGGKYKWLSDLGRVASGGK